MVRGTGTVGGNVGPFKKFEWHATTRIPSCAAFHMAGADLLINRRVGWGRGRERRIWRDWGGRYVLGNGEWQEGSLNHLLLLGGGGGRREVGMGRLVTWMRAPTYYFFIFFS